MPWTRIKEISGRISLIVGLIALLTTSVGYISGGKEWVEDKLYEADSIRIINVTEKYVQDFTKKVEHLDSLDAALVNKLSSQGKAVGLRADSTGTLYYRDEYNVTHRCHKYATLDTLSGNIHIMLRYIDQETLQEYHIAYKTIIQL